MTGPRLHEHRLRFEETNDFVDFILGLCAIAPPPLREFKPAPPSKLPLSSEEGLTHFILGVLLFASRFNRFVALETRHGSQDESPILTPTLPRDLLR